MLGSAGSDSSVSGGLPDPSLPGAAFQGPSLLAPAASSVKSGAAQIECADDPVRLAITCSTNEPLQRILQWMRYHQMIGFSLFYLFVEGHAEDDAVVDVLRQLVGVKVLPNRVPLCPSQCHAAA
jgi:hypothetical protein